MLIQLSFRGRGERERTGKGGRGYKEQTLSAWLHAFQFVILKVFASTVGDSSFAVRLLQMGPWVLGRH